MAVLLAAALVLRGLSPFEPRPEPQAFQWIPFGGFLDGSMLVNSQSLFEKTFLYGALVWLVREAGLRLAVAWGYLDDVHLERPLVLTSDLLGMLTGLLR